jgi:hypothetical protein
VFTAHEQRRILNSHKWGKRASNYPIFPIVTGFGRFGRPSAEPTGMAN